MGDRGHPESERQRMGDPLTDNRLNIINTNMSDKQLDDFEARVAALNADKESIRTTLECTLDTFEYMSMKDMILRAIGYEWGGQHIVLTDGEPRVYLDTLEYKLYAIWSGVEVTREWQGVPW